MIVYVPYMYGGMCNNILQISNVLRFLKTYNLPLEYLKISKIYERRYDSKYHKKQNKDLIFDVLDTYFINHRLNLDDFIVFKYKKDTNIELDLNKNYCLRQNINDTITYKEIYEFFNIRKKQEYMLSKCTNFNNTGICIHVRRNDFVTYRKNRIYTENDIKNIIQKHCNNVVNIITDDIDWCRQFNVYKNVNFLYDLDLNLDEEFLLASTCKILYGDGYSTFSRLLKQFSKIYHE